MNTQALISKRRSLIEVIENRRVRHGPRKSLQRNLCWLTKMQIDRELRDLKRAKRHA